MLSIRLLYLLLPIFTIAMRTRSALLFTLSALSLTACATQPPGTCQTVMYSGESDTPIITGGVQPTPLINRGEITGEETYKESANAGCHLTGMRLFVVASATFPPNRLHDSLRTLAEDAAKKHNPPLSSEKVIILRVGLGDATRIFPSRLGLIPLPIVTDRQPATVVIYTTTDHWNGPAPEDQPWVKVVK